MQHKLESLPIPLISSTPPTASPIAPTRPINRQPDVILSDMLHNTTGQHDVDHFKSLSLCRSALDFSVRNLSSGGTFLCKVLRGEDDKEFMKEIEEVFRDCKIIKPSASRNESAEIYILAKNKRKM